MAVSRVASHGGIHKWLSQCLGQDDHCCPARHQNDQTPFSADHVEIRTHLSLTLVERPLGGIDIAPTVDHDG